jgi:copper chaperone CopZ
MAIRKHRSLADLIAALALAAPACNCQETPRPSATEEANMKTVIIPIEGMSCSACAARIKKTITSIDGVSDVEVNLADQNARVRFAPSKLSHDRLVGAVNGLGYHASAPAENPTEAALKEIE